MAASRPAPHHLHHAAGQAREQCWQQQKLSTQSDCKATAENSLALNVQGPSPEAVNDEICWFKGERKACCQNVLKQPPKGQLSTCKFICVSTTQSALNIYQKWHQEYPAHEHWKLLPKLCYLKRSHCLTKEQTCNSYLQYKVPCKDEDLVTTYCRACQQDEHHHLSLLLLTLLSPS